MAWCRIPIGQISSVLSVSLQVVDFFVPTLSLDNIIRIGFPLSRFGAVFSWVKRATLFSNHSEKLLPLSASCLLASQCKSFFFPMKCPFVRRLGGSLLLKLGDTLFVILSCATLFVSRIAVLLPSIASNVVSSCSAQNTTVVECRLSALGW